MVKTPHHVKETFGHPINANTPRKIAGYLMCLTISWEDLERGLISLDEIFDPKLCISESWKKLSHPVSFQPGLSRIPASPEVEETMELHEGVYSKLLLYSALEGKKILVLNLDAHHDRGYSGGDFMSDLHCGNWVSYAEVAEIARVVHLPSYFRNASYVVPPSERQPVNWNSKSRRHSISEEIDLIVRGENIAEIWLTVDYDSFSLRAPSNDSEARGGKAKWTGRPYNMPPDEIEAELHALKGFLVTSGIKLHRILPYSSPDYLAQPDPNYIRQIDGLIQKVFGPINA